MRADSCSNPQQTFFAPSFTFYSVAIPPVASHAFGWEPFAISNVLALQAVVLFIGMVASMWFSMKSAKDISL